MPLQLFQPERMQRNWHRRIAHGIPLSINRAERDPPTGRIYQGQLIQIWGHRARRYVLTVEKNVLHHLTKEVEFRDDKVISISGRDDENVGDDDLLKDVPSDVERFNGADKVVVHVTAMDGFLFFQDSA